MRVGRGRRSWTFELVRTGASSWGGPGYGMRGASMDVQGGGVVVGNGSSGQCCWRGEANSVCSIREPR